MWFWIWLVTFVSGGGLIQVLDSERRRLADRLREWTDTATSQQELIRRRDAQIESLEMTIKELQVQIGNRDQSFKKLQEKLSEVYTELHNLRDAAIRREAVIEGLKGAQSRSDFFQKQLEELRAVHKGSRHCKPRWLSLAFTESMLAEQTAGHGLYSSASIPSGDGQTGR